jgi:TolA-binding protein
MISRFAGRRLCIINDGIRIMRNWLCALLILLAATTPSWAASRAETRAFAAAAKAFTDEGWEYADREFAAFLQKFPKSERRAEAALLQAQARCKLADYRRAIELLTAEQAGAGPLADQYAFWTGEAQFQSSNYVAAAEAYRVVVTNFPASKLRLEASVNEAASWAGLKDWARVEELLSQPAGAFQQLALTAPTSELVVRGGLVLAEARLARGNPAAAEEGLGKLDGRGLPPALAWRQSFLLCRALLGRGLAEQVLLNSSNLVALARTTAQPALLAESLALQAGALEERGQLEKAADTYSQNLAPGAPVDLQRQAMLKLAELALVRGRLEDAAEKLDDFLEHQTNSPACDMALLALGELHLKQHVAALTGGSTNTAPTNALAVALASFEALRVRFPQSALLGKAELDRGWCLWLTTNLAESAAAFAAAADALPPSYDQSVARFKLADAQFQQRQFEVAITNYGAVVASADANPAVKTNLCEPALYQIVRAATEITNSAAADAAASQLLESFPESYVTESGLLMVGQGLARHGDPARARHRFEDLLKRFPNSEHAAQVRLAVARTHELQRNWTNAVQEYEGWLSAFPTNAERPRAEYALALASYQAGDETNALTRFTNFVALYATNELAPQAQWWVADYFFRQGGTTNYVEAEKNYQLIFQTWSNSPLAFEARMMAGRTAMARQGWASAIDYFTNLTGNPCPADLKV